MNNFEQFRQELHDALAHLHDPDYQPSALLYSVLGRDLGDEAGPVQSEIIQAIKSLEPPPDVPPDARVRRDFDVLHYRFVLRLTQEQTAERMHVSVRSMRRAQREAMHKLARLLWEHRLVREVLTEDLKREEKVSSDIQEADWRSQVRQDLASLQMSAPGNVADVGETINYAVELERGLISRYGVRLLVGGVQRNLVAAIHPSVLRQVLIMAIAQLARCVSSGQITILAAPEDEHVKIVLTGYASPEGTLPDAGLIEEILAVQGGLVEVGTEEDRVSLCIKVPAVGKVSVLVVDDNLDLLHFYQRCAAGTKYHIIHAPQGQRTVDAIQAIAPDIIVLDILLPDTDGWELLAQLHSSSATRSIPVIICSIVREEELASAFGATLYLPKPVQHRQFIQALDQVLDQALAGSPRNPVNNAAAC